MEKVDISIVCATYNQEKYVKNALDGFLMQKGGFEYEILIHDDASTDGTTKILQEYKKEYPNKIKLILQKENQYSKGVDILRTYIYPIVKGKYIAFCEGDDFWIYNKKLQKQYDLMESNPNISLCYHNALVYREESDELQINVHNHPSGYIDDREIISPTKGWYPTASFFGRTDYMKNQPDFKAATGDEALRTYMACKGDLYFINAAWSVYRDFADGSWNQRYRSDKKIAARYIVDTVNYFTKFDEYSGKRFSKYLHIKYMQAIKRLFNIKYAYGYTVEQFENDLNDLKIISDHVVDKLMNVFHDEYIIQSIDYYECTVLNRIKSIYQNGNKIFIYGAGAEAVKAIIVLMRFGVNISGLIVTKRDNKIDTLLGYPIRLLEEMKFKENIFVWPCLVNGRSEVLEILGKLQTCTVLI
nr:glycosyltransferase [uncultured Schaedlerella sp.]